MTIVSGNCIYIHMRLRPVNCHNVMKTFFALITTTLITLIVSSSSAQSLSWDPYSSGGPNGGSGNWDTSDSFWFNGATDVPWASGNDAYFEGAAGTVVLQTGISAGNIYFTNVTGGDYYITNLTGAEVLSVSGTIDTGGSEDTIAAPISSGTLNKNGAGRLHLPVANSLGPVMINQGELSVENNSALGSSATVADGAALELNSTTNDLLNNFLTSVTINGSGITNSGALRNTSGVTTFYGQVILGENNSVIYADDDSALVFDAEYGPLTDNGNNYNLIISGNGTGNVHLGATSIGGTLIIEGPASCYNYLNSITPTDWKSTYVGQGATLEVENNNSFGTDPATLMTTNCVVDGGAIISGGTYTMYANDGITMTANGGALTNNSGTWTTCNIYSSNAPVTIGGAGSVRPGGAAGGTLGTINLGTGAFIKAGAGDCNLGYANPALEIYSNLVVNGGSLTFNYDSSGGTSSLGAVPSSLNPSNIVFNGGSMHVGHSTTIGATRGIYVASGGGTIEDVVSSGGTVTINSPISGPGNISIPNGHAGVTSGVILAGNNTYTGTMTVGASSQVTVGSGASGTLGTGDTTDNGTLAFNRTGSYTYGGNITGSGTIVKNAGGAVTLTGACTYSGATTIGAGALLVDNTNASAITVNSSGVLGGTGVLGGAVTVKTGGTLALGTGTLSVSNNVSITGNVSVSVNSSASPSSGTAIVTGTLANSGTGTIVVNNVGPALKSGDSFQLFSQPVSGGDTMTISGGGVQWANNLLSSGSISVVGPLPTPVINGFSLSGTNLVFSGTNGYTGGGYYVVASTNLLSPLSSWKPVSTNQFGSGGVFSVTNAIVPGTPVNFYTLKLE
jgi:autotransporter-associated beta strand protein